MAQNMGFCQETVVLDNSSLDEESSYLKKLVWTLASIEGIMALRCGRLSVRFPTHSALFNHSNDLDP